MKEYEMSVSWVKNWQALPELDVAGYLTEGFNEIAVSIVMRIFAGQDPAPLAEGFVHMPTEQKEYFATTLNDHLLSILSGNEKELKKWQEGFELFNQSLCKVC